MSGPFARLRILSDRSTRIATAITTTTDLLRVRKLRALLDHCEAVRAGLLERVTWPQHPAPELRAWLDRNEALARASRTKALAEMTR